MKLGTYTKGGEVHALRRKWPILGPWRSLCHTGGTTPLTTFDGAPERVSCQWCRLKLGLARLPKRVRAEVVEEAQPQVQAPAAAEVGSYLPSILFAEPVVDAEVVEGGA